MSSHDSALDELPSRGDSGAMLNDLSNALVRLYKEHFGRGPTSTRSMWAGPDTIVCILEDSLTPPERLLQQMGAHDRLREMRTFFQYAHEEAFRAEVERIIGRRVRSFLSSFDPRTGTSGEVFVLERVDIDEDDA